MHGHPQPDPFLRATIPVVLLQGSHQRTRQRLHEPDLRHLGPGQDQHAVATVLATAASPPDPGMIESPRQCAPQAVADSELMRIGPPLIPEPLNVHNDNGPMYRRTRMRHTTSRRQ
jgi:hypothetical protein